MISKNPIAYLKDKIDYILHSCKIDTVNSRVSRSLPSAVGLQ